MPRARRAVFSSSFIMAEPPPTRNHLAHRATHVDVHRRPPRAIPGVGRHPASPLARSEQLARPSGPIAGLVSISLSALARFSIKERALTRFCGSQIQPPSSPQGEPGRARVVYLPAGKGNRLDWSWHDPMRIVDCLSPKSEAPNPINRNKSECSKRDNTQHEKKEIVRLWFCAFELGSLENCFGFRDSNFRNFSVSAKASAITRCSWARRCPGPAFLSISRETCRGNSTPAEDGGRSSEIQIQGVHSPPPG